MAAIGALALLLPSSVAQAAARTPSKPHGIHLVHVTATSFTITAHASTYATRYRLYASTDKSRLYVDVIDSAPHSPRSDTPRLTFDGLAYTADPYYYRVAAINGSKRRYSTIRTMNLRPATPTGLRIAVGHGGTSLRWNSGAAGGFRIKRATDAAMTQGVHRYKIRGLGHQFTPYGLVKGTRYYFEVRAANGKSRSHWSGPVGAVPSSTEQRVRVMSYNLFEATGDGQHRGTEIVAPWSKRRLGAVKLIDEADPDVIDIQEGAAWTAAVKGPRQVDSLVSALGGRYGLADTEIPPSQRHYKRTGNYVLYKKSTFALVNKGGHWSLPYNSTAAYQVLRNLATGARFLSVSPHLVVGPGATLDAHRQTQTQSLLSQSRAYAAARHIPIIYAGDFNSCVNHKHVFDGPSVAMRAAGVADGLDAAQHLRNEQYNSANQFVRTALASGQSIDHVYAPAGVGVRSWQLMLDLSRGQFVGPIPSDHNPLVSDLVYPY